MELAAAKMNKLRRADCYKLLAACFCEPEKELFQEEAVLENLEELLEEVCPTAVKFTQTMKDFFDQTEPEELAVEYAALFVGPFELKAPPYASVYLENQRKVMGDSTMETLRLYQEAGLKHDVKEPADHISIELEFLYYLISSELEAELQEDQKESLFLIAHQKKFLNQYLGKWIHPFCES
ncbi:MAG: molecular chaperone TorD family protein, partial [Deltaproteobacteria bacterium]|nr:molecular chaperone TorD family protein [Deltaproteobacteria bacterium]